MAKFAKWIGGALGWTIGGPVGGAIGLVMGALIDEMGDAGNTTQSSSQRSHSYDPFTAPGDFNASLLVLTAAVMRGDGKIVRAELDYVKRFLLANYGEAKALQLLQVLKELLQREIAIRDVSLQIRQYMPESQRLQLLHYLFGISAADGDVHPREVLIIESIAGYLGIAKEDYESIKAMHYRDVDSDYKILEVDPTASDEDVKKAYRRMAVRFHPDKVADLGEEAQKMAKERFQKVQDAWDAIRKKRNIP